MENRARSFLSFVLPTLFPEAEGELEVRPFCLGEFLDAVLSGKRRLYSPSAMA